MKRKRVTSSFLRLSHKFLMCSKVSSDGRLGWVALMPGQIHTRSGQTDVGPGLLSGVESPDGKKRRPP